MEEGAATLVSGRYELLERIGAGGFGETWRAHDTLLDVTVAVKVFHDADEERAEKALREARSLARYAQLPGIVAVRDLVRDMGNTYLVMDFIEGSDLADALAAGGRLGLEETLRILRPVAEALGQLHREGYVHRDVSPENIRVRQDNTGVLLDFGSVMNLGQQRRETILVKPGYAPPEQYGDPSTQGPWSDVYALAATAYHCLCGAAPPDSLQRTFTDELKRPAQLGANLPADAEAALRAGLALDYRERTQSAGELIAGLAGEGTASAGEQGAVADAAQPAIGQSAGPAAGASPEPPQPSQPAVQPPSARTQAEPQAQTRSGHRAASGSPGKAAARPRGRIKRWIPIVAAAAVVVVIAVVLVNLNGNASAGGAGRNVYRDDAWSFGWSVVTEAEVTDGIIEMVGNDAETSSIRFERCVITDKQIELLGKKKGIKELEFKACTGFSSLGPLAGMSDLNTLTVTYMEDVNLDELLPDEMAGVTSLKLSCLTLSGGEHALERFPNLEDLNLSYTDLSKYGAELLSGNGNLTTLKMHDCNLSTLNWAEGYPELAYLNASGNGITDLAPLVSCSKLHTLKLGGNAISSLEGLQGHDRLKTLNLADNEIEDASLLASCPKLESLGLRNNNLNDLSFCEPLTKLTALDVSHNQISDISKLASALDLGSLAINDNQVGDISVLGTGFTKLTELNMANNQITSLEPLGACAALRDVVVTGNQLTSLDGMQDKLELDYLLANDNHIGDISALVSSVAELDGIDLGHNEIRDLSALGGLTTRSNYIDVALDHNDISSLEGLSTDVRYDKLVLYGNPITDFSAFLESEVKWHGIYLPYSEGAYYGNLAGNNDLYTMYLVDVPFDHRVLVERSMQGDAERMSSKPKYITSAEADAEVADARKDINAKVESATSWAFGFMVPMESDDEAPSVDSENQS